MTPEAYMEKLGFTDEEKEWASLLYSVLADDQSVSYDDTVSLFFLVPTVGFALIGLKDDSLTRYLKTWWTWRQRRRVVTYRGEVHPHESERRYLRQFRCGRP